MEQKERNKCLCVIRTSTIRQEIFEQRKEVLSMAHEDGWTDEDIIVIGKQGASAIKLDDAYMRNLEEIFTYLESGTIACIYAWAVDRLGRNEEVLMKLKNKAIDTHTQLKIKTPSLTLLDKDGSVNGGVELAFTLFATLSKQEMQSKKARFARSKKRNKEIGRFNGGRVLFGYKNNTETGKLEIDEVNGPLLHQLFEEYLDIPFGIAYLAKKYPQVTWREYSTEDSRIMYINRLLKNENYKGNVLYPRLIEDELFEKVQEKMRNYRILPKYKYDYTTYYLQGIIFDLSSGVRVAMRVKKSEASYVSKTEHFSISINNTDSMVLQVLEEALHDLFDSQDFKDIQNEVIRRCKRERKIYESEMESVRKKLDELESKYFLTKMSKQLYNDLHYKLEKQMDDIEHVLDKISADLIEATNRRDLSDFHNSDIYALGDNERRDLILRYTESVECTKIDVYKAFIDIRFKDLLSVCNARYEYDRKERRFRDVTTDVWCNINVVRDVKGRSWRERRFAEEQRKKAINKE